MNEYYTPPTLMHVVRRVLGEIDLDPASCEMANNVVKARRYYTQADDGWTKPWWGRVYLNPPSGVGHGRKPLCRWWDRLCVEYLSGRVEAAVFCAFHLNLFAYPTRYITPPACPFAVMRTKVNWVRPDGNTSTIRSATAFFLLSHDNDMKERFRAGFARHAYVLQPVF